MSKVIVHIDLNTFFVRCEELKNPSLVGKPVIIGHLGRGGIVSTCSYEARKYGAKSGMPTYMALQKCPNAVVIGGNFQLYAQKSEEFFTFLERYTSLIEKASIDECFMDLTDVIKHEKDPEKFFKSIQDNLYKQTGLKCSIGVGPTKFLAKMASDMKKPMGITIIRRKDVRKMLDPLPIEDFFGIGKKTAPRLRAIGINTIGDLAKRVNDDNADTKNEFGKFYYGIKEWINGYGSDVVSNEKFDPQSIGHSTTLAEDATDIDALLRHLESMCRYVSSDAKAANKVGASVQIVLKDNEFKVINRSRKLPKKSNEFQDIYKIATELLKENYTNKPTRLIGVTLQKLTHPHETYEQMSIFDNYEEVKEQCATQLLIGELNRKMHKSVFKTAREHLTEMKNGTK